MRLTLCGVQKGRLHTFDPWCPFFSCLDYFPNFCFLLTIILIAFLIVTTWTVRSKMQSIEKSKIQIDDRKSNCDDLNNWFYSSPDESALTKIVIVFFVDQFLTPLGENPSGKVFIYHLSALGSALLLACLPFSNSINSHFEKRKFMTALMADGPCPAQMYMKASSDECSLPQLNSFEWSY